MNLHEIALTASSRLRVYRFRHVRVKSSLYCSKNRLVLLLSKMMVRLNNNRTRAESFRIAFSGLFHAISSQKNFQIQIAIGTVVLLAAWLLGFDRVEWLILIITISLVLVAELLNTVVEVVIDLAVKEKLLPDAKLAKDVSAAAVLLTSIFAVVVGLILFVPHLL